MPNAPLKHVSGSTVTTVIDPRFGTGADPTQPSGWGGTTTGGGSTGVYTGGVRGMGFHVPPGSLDNLTAALANGATDQRVEIAYIGDSTGAGSGPDSGLGGPPTKLRSLLLGSGLTNGGHGSGNSMWPTFFTWTFSAGGNVYSWPPNGCFMSNTVGETVTGVGTGTAMRLSGWNTHRLSYTIDGGASQFIPSTDNWFHYIPGLPPGEHTIVITNESGTSATGGTGVMVEFLNDTGVVVHNDSVSGGTTGNYSAYIESRDYGTLGNQGLQYALGKTLSTAPGQTDWRTGPGPRPKYRNTKAAIFALGLNNMPSQVTNEEADVAGATFASKLTEDTALFIRMCRMAAVDPIIVVPHFESDSRGWRFAGRGRTALISVAEAHGAAWCSYDDAMRLAGIGQQDNPHLGQEGYDAEAQFLFDNVLSLALPE